MGATLFCSRCGLEVPLDVIGQPELVACISCGNKTFVPARWIDWAAALTETDKNFLRANKIAIT